MRNSPTTLTHTNDCYLFGAKTENETAFTDNLAIVGWGKTSLNDQSGAAFAAPGQDPESFRNKGINLISSVRTLCRG